MNDDIVEAVVETAVDNLNTAAVSGGKAVEARVLDVEREVEAWFHDLLLSIPALRETETFNKVRIAVTDLKKRIS